MKWRAEDKVRFGRLVVAQRGEKQLTQQALAKKTGVCYHTIFGIENGLHQPRDKTLHALRKFFGPVKLPAPGDPDFTSPTPRIPPEGIQHPPMSDAEEKGRLCGKLAPELVTCLYEYLMKQGREGHISVDSGGAIKKSGQ